jgi:hypothetical protein
VSTEAAVTVRRGWASGGVHDFAAEMTCIGFVRRGRGVVEALSAGTGLDRARPPLSWHALVPFTFRIQVSHQTQEPPSEFLPAAPGYNKAPRGAAHMPRSVLGGIGRLRVDPDSGRPLRLAILRVLRRYGATLAEASDTYTRLTGPGVIGTRAEVLLLANRLNMTGVTTQLDP